MSCAYHRFRRLQELREMVERVTGSVVIEVSRETETDVVLHVRVKK